MYVEHPCFEKPDDANVTIWRYMDFSKYISLLDKQALYFTSIEGLKDKFEGTLPKANISLIKSSVVPIGIPEMDTPELLERRYKTRLNGLNDFSVINCWYIGKYESAGMWEIYDKNGSAVAIRSTFQRLCDSFKDYPLEVHIGRVKYIDYDTESLQNLNAFEQLLHKKVQYGHENELRAIIMHLPPEHYSPVPILDITNNGEYVHVELDTLIEEIIVSPESPKWFIHLVESINKKYYLNKRVQPSNLSYLPEI